MNLIILADFMCRLRLQGIQKFREGGFYNILDATVVISSILLFTLVIISKSANWRFLEEVGEEIILLIWSVFQTLRIVLIFKKQKMANQSAHTLINFVNIVE